MNIILIKLFLFQTKFVVCVFFSHGMAKLLPKEEMGRASYKVCILFQLLEKEGKNNIYIVIYKTAVWPYTTDSLGLLNLVLSETPVS